jgi:hypothetical protein
MAAPPAPVIDAASFMQQQAFRQVLLTAEQGKGLQINGGFARREGKVRRFSPSRLYLLHFYHRFCFCYCYDAV